MRLRLIVTLAAILTISACASTGTGDGSSRNVISADELGSVSDAGDITVYQAIERLRPQWLQPFRSVDSGERALAEAWLDERRLGDLEEFQRHRAGSAVEIRYIPGRDAANRYRAAAGVIMVYTTRPRS